MANADASRHPQPRTTTGQVALRSPTRRRRRRTLTWLALVSVAALVATLAPIPAAHAAHGFGNFETDGNKADAPAGGPVDWDTPAVKNATQVFLDGTGGTDDSFVGGSKELEPGFWECSDAHSVPDKSDIIEGGLYFKQAPNGDQFLSGYWIRKSTNGSVHLDYELNQLTQPNPACLSMPKRKNKDVVFAFDFGGSKTDAPAIRLFEWTFTPNTNDTVGTFTLVQAGQWEAEVNEKNEMGEPMGKFGEFTFKLNGPGGPFPNGITCGQFGATHIKSRSSKEISSALKDKSGAQRFRGPCPSSTFDKKVRNVTAGQQDFTEQTAAKPGDVVEFLLRYTNNGPGKATNVVLTDKIQPNTTFQSCAAAPVDIGCSKTGTGPGSTVTWDFGEVPPNGVRDGLLRVKLADKFPNGQSQVKNTGTADTGEEDPMHDSSTVIVTAEPRFDVISKQADDDVVEVGDSTTYRIRITNTGDADGVVMVVDDYDEAHVAVSQISDNGKDKVQANNRVIEWTNVLVPAGSEKVLTYKGTFKGPFTSGGGTGPCSGHSNQYPVHNTATAGTGTAHETVCVVAEPEFDVEKTSSRSHVPSGETAVYTVTVTNVGDAVGQTSVVDDYDQDHVTVSDVNPPGTDNGDTITWQTGSLQPGQKAVFTYTATFGGAPTNPGTENCSPKQFPVVNLVTVDGDEARHVVCQIPDPEFAVTKSAQPAFVNLHDGLPDEVTYSVTVENLSGVEATTDVVDDFDETHVQILDSGGGVVAGGVITWTGVTIPAGESKTLSYTATIIGTFGGPTGSCGANTYPVLNKVTVGDVSDVETVCVRALPILDIEKVVQEPTRAVVTEGDLITYAISYSNTGKADATNVVISDGIPAGTTFVDCDPDPCGGNPVIWELGTVEVGEAGQVLLTVAVVEDPELLGILGCQICNTVDLTSSQEVGDTDEECRDVVLHTGSDLTHASGQAVGADILVRQHNDDGTVETIKDVEILPAESEVDDPHGPEQDGQAESLRQVGVRLLPGDGDEMLLTADAIHAMANSVVTTNEARQMSVAEVQKLRLLKDVLFAGSVFETELIRSAAKTESSTGSGEGTTDSSALAALRLFLDLDGDGGAEPVLDESVDCPVADQISCLIPLEDPAKTADEGDLLEAVFGAGSFLELNKRSPDTSSAAGQLVEADATMVELHITRLAPLNLEIRLAIARAHAQSKFPPFEVCPGAQAVRARAYALEVDALNQPPVVAAETRIPRVGGTADFATAAATVQDGPLGQHIATASEVVSHSSGVVTLSPDDKSTAGAYLYSSDVCLLRMSKCIVEAKTTRAQSGSEAELGESPSSNDTGTIIAELKVHDPDGVERLHLTGESLQQRNQTLIDLSELTDGAVSGFLTLNEQIHSCDDQAIQGDAVVETNTCAVDEEVRRTVTLLHLVLTDPDIAAIGGSPVLEVRAIHADSGAVFESAP